MPPPRDTLRRGLLAIAASLLLVVSWLVLGDRDDRIGGPAQNHGAQLSSGASLPFLSSLASPRPPADDAAAGAQPNVVATVLLRTPADDAIMRQRLRVALHELGVPMPADPKPRRPLAKETLFQPPGEQHQILVKFQDGLLARAAPDGSVVVSAEQADPGLVEVIKRHGLRFTANHTASENDLVKMEAEALAATGEYPADLGGMLLVAAARPEKESVWAAANALQRLGVTEFVTLSSLDMPPPPPMPVDTAPPTPLLVTNQTYRGEAGINIDAVWELYGQQPKGQNVRVTDCEYNYNPLHEDMAGLVTPQPGVSGYYTNFGDDHGTAVLGILVAAENAYGMTGMVPQATARFYGDGATVNGMNQSRSACITAALAASSRGDVVLLEMQTFGAGATGNDDRYVPAEYDQAVWTAVKTGTDAGKHVVAAAGNGGTSGGENLDSSAYTAYRNRGDSGSIIVGAGNTSRARLSYSTYGARVNLQGWGAWNVATLGYGDLQTVGGDPNQKYTRDFSGTSSASPIVTAAVVAVESMARSRLGRSLSPSEMRQLLVSTGKAQTGILTTPIGPLPDVPAALAQLLPVPKISSFSPIRGTRGTSITITGERFAGVSGVAIGGVNASFAVVNETTVTAVVPAQARTGKVSVVSTQGTGVSAADFSIVAGPAVATVSLQAAGVGPFSTTRGAPSGAQILQVSGYSLISGIDVSAPEGYEVSLDGVDYSAAVSIPANAAADAAANYIGGWQTGSNGGVGFGPWDIEAKQLAGWYYAGAFLGDPTAAGITGFGSTAFGLYANPANTLASIHASRALAGPLRIGDTLRFRWAVNWDSGGAGKKGFAIYSGGPGMTELLRVEQGNFPGEIFLVPPGGLPLNTGISYGTGPMTWLIRRSGEDILTVSATARDGSAATVFEQTIPALGAPDAFCWFAGGLDASAGPADNDKRQPYFNDLAILTGSAGGGVVGVRPVWIRISSAAPAGSVSGAVAVTSQGADTRNFDVTGSVGESPDVAFDAWAQSHGLDPSGSGGKSQDADGDGFDNLAEFAFGSSPVSGTASLASVQAGSVGVFTLRWLQLEQGASYALQHTGSLGPTAWHEATQGPSLSADQSAAPEGYDFYEFSAPGAETGFYRVQATLE
jgi:hypothetical protein